MHLVSFFGKKESELKRVISFPFWSEHPDFELDTVIIKSRNELIERNLNFKIDILIAITDEMDIFSSENIHNTLRQFSRTAVIVIGKDTSYSTVREYYINGIFDYLIDPIDEKKLEKSLLRLYEDIGENYIVTNLKLKADALIDNIFLGGGEEKIIIGEIFDQIYTDWNNNLINCQTVTDKAKTYIYETLIARKPWLEKFLYKPDFYHHLGFTVKRRDDLEYMWLIDFRFASSMVKKYQMIDDKLVYRIGKYVVVHVDEKLSLDEVSKGVYLNPSYISHIFKKITNMSFVNFITEVKIDRAKVLLRDKNIRINEVAYTLSFANQEYFTKIFKKKVGVTPVEYQQMLFEKYICTHIQ